MIKTGAMLKAERESKNISLHEVSMALKVSTRILRAIENGESDHLPAKTFLRGFVRSYALFLRMNPQLVLEMFHSEMGSTKLEIIGAPTEVSGDAAAVAEEKNTATTVTSAKAKDFFVEDFFSTNKIVSAVVIVALLVLIGVISNLIEKYQAEKSVDVNPVIAEIEEKNISQPQSTLAGEENKNSSMNLVPPNSLTPGSNTSSTAGALGVPSLSGAVTMPTQKPIVIPVPNAAPAANPVNPVVPVKPAVTTATPTPKPIIIPPPETNAKPANLVAPVLTNVLSAKPPVVVPPAPAPTPAVVKPAVVPPTVTPAPQFFGSGQPVEVMIEAKGAVKITSRSPDKTDNVTLSAGQVHVFRSSKGIKLEISDGGSANIIVNGSDKGLAGTAGKAVVLTY